MFFLSLLSDSIPVEPEKFKLPHLDHIKSVIKGKYIDKVIPNVGLVVAFYDIAAIREARIRPGDGRAHFKVEFRLVIFKPYKDEVMEGLLDASDASGLKVSLQFFQDVKIPPSSLLQPAEFDEGEKIWFWDFDGTKLPYHLNQRIRFRVVDVCFDKRESSASGGSVALLPTQDAHTPPMVVIGSVATEGLGISAWWEDAAE